jgi:hypothetical protein
MRFISLCVAMTLWVLASAVHAESPLETLAPDGALANLKARRGVVFVDLFAHW